MTGESEPMSAEVRIRLVRHGETGSNVAGLLDTAAPGADLTELGHSQARGLVHRLADDPVDVLVASPLARTRQTAGPLATARGLALTLDERLREISAGDLEMRGDAVAMRTYLGTVLAWVSGDLDARVPGGESGTEVYARFDAALDEIALSGARDVVVVSHGAMIRSWCAVRAGVPFSVFAANPVPNTGLVGLAGLPGAWRVTSWVDRTVAELASEGATSGATPSSITPDLAVHGRRPVRYGDEDPK